MQGGARVPSPTKLGKVARRSRVGWGVAGRGALSEPGTTVVPAEHRPEPARRTHPSPLRVDTFPSFVGKARAPCLVRASALGREASPCLGAYGASPSMTPQRVRCARTAPDWPRLGSSIEPPAGVGRHGADEGRPLRGRRGARVADEGLRLGIRTVAFLWVRVVHVAHDDVPALARGI